MIEKVTEAIRVAEKAWWESSSEPTLSLQEALARAAMAAMREPSHAMFLAGRDLALSGKEDALMNRDSVKERWRVMVDAALEAAEAREIAA